MLGLDRQSLIVAVLFALSAPFASPQSVLNFPRLSFGPGTIVGVAVVNLNSEDATLKFTAYGSDGGELATASVDVQAGRQFATLVCAPRPANDNSLFGETCGEVISGSNGWFQGVSQSDNLTGFFLFLDNPELGPIAQLDGSDLPEAASAIVFNQISVDSQSSTQLTVVNPNDQPVLVRLSISGAEAAPGEKTLPAHGSLVVDNVAGFFGVPTVDPAAFVRAETDGAEILGFEVVRLADGDRRALNGQNAAALLNTLYFPQFAVFENLDTQLGLINYSNQNISVVITAHAPDGSPFGNPVARTLAGSESLRESVAELFALDASALHEGWIQVTATSEAINGHLSYSLAQTDTARAATAAVRAAALGNTQAVFSHIATDLGFFTGLAALNPGAQAANLTIEAFNETGESLGSQTSVLRPGRRISRLVEELIPNAAGQAGGFIRIDSDVPVFLTSLFGTNELTVLANIPPQPRPPEPEEQPAPGRPRVRPIVSVLRPGESRTFRTEELTGTIQWSVNGVPGGNATWGFIDENGRYTAPNAQPPVRPLTITAQAGDRSAAASVDIVVAQPVLTDLGVIQAVAYLSQLSRLYTAELALFQAPEMARLGLREPAQTSAARIFEVTQAGDSGDFQREPIGEFVQAEVAKMIGFVDSRGAENLLLLLRESGGQGRLTRLDPLSRTVVETRIRGLDRPTSMAFNTAGDLLVATADRVIVIPRCELNLNCPPASRRFDDPSRLAAGLFEGVASEGIAVDRCTGRIYVSDPTAGEILELTPSTGATRSVARGLSNPGELLGFYREGVPCPTSFQLLTAEDLEPDQLTLVIPGNPDGERVVRPWVVSQEEAVDLAFLPLQNPLRPDQSVALGEVVTRVGQVSFVDVPDVYEDRPVNSPPPPQPPMAPPNHPPTANAGSDRVVGFLEIVELDGSASVDPDGDPLTFSWMQQSGPPVALQPNGNVSNPTFEAPDSEAAFVFELTVDDGQAISRATVRIAVQHRSFLFQDFATPARLRLNPVAQQFNQTLRLTPAGLDGFPSAAVWHLDQQFVRDGFETQFQFRITEPQGSLDCDGNPGGDGFTFAVQNDSLEPIDSGGGLLGYSGLGESLVVEFDTWCNSQPVVTMENDLNDPDGNHISVHPGGNANENASLGRTSAIADLSDGMVHDVTITYVPGTLTIFLDEVQILEVSVDLQSVMSLNRGRAWVGFTSASAGATENHDILSWRFQEGPPQ